MTCFSCHHYRAGDPAYCTKRKPGFPQVGRACRAFREIVALSKNPYQILKPANSTPYLFPVMGGGGAYSLTADTGGFAAEYEPGSDEGECQA